MLTLRTRNQNERRPLPANRTRLSEVPDWAYNVNHHVPPIEFLLKVSHFRDAAEQIVAWSDIAERFFCPLDELGEIRIEYGIAAPDEEQRAIDGEEIEDCLRVWMVLHREIGTQPEHDRFRFFEPAVEMKDRIGVNAHEHILHVISL